jgi:hypothetical protein
MQITKTVTLKVASISPARVRLVPPPVKPTDEQFKDGYQISLATVDSSGRYIGRTNLSLCNGRVSNGTTDLGEIPTTLVPSIEAALAELDKALSPLVASGKIDL